ncbi:hypothetical protein pipiens_008057 [Culex pipiens pipiens]|uniref:Uncharacterized protein n=1 Tax=Culex pipiens pipiens TaxID=38569 RepID=A0ABD1DJ94_CULPP
MITIPPKYFRILGYVYGYFGALCTFFDVVDRVYYNYKANTHDILYYISPSISFIVLIFFIILLIGIRKKNLILLLTDEKVSNDFIQLLATALVMFIGIYFFCLWIINGVIGAIQHEEGSNETVFYHSEAINKQEV